VDSGLFDRAKKAAETAGYSSIEEFVTHIIETELAKHETTDDDKVTDQLRGLGYIE
ncbi:unnamed protein product, partial [marine sediment metagenome]